jgi:hypothetical protein
MPDGTPGIAGGAGVVLLSAEDHLAATIRPRLETAAADLSRVMILRGVKKRDTGGQAENALERSFVLPHDIPRLERAMRKVDARLVVIDPLMAYLDSAVNSWSDQHVRRALAPLAALAERTGAAILILRHLNKASGMSAIQRGGGSIGIIGAARSGLLVAKHPDNPDHERVLASVKSNLGPPMPSQRFRLATPLRNVEGLEEDGLEDLADVPVVEWLGACELNATALLAKADTGAGEDAPTKVADATAWLREALADGPHLKQHIEQAAEADGIADKTLRHAREELEVVTVRKGYGAEMRTWWHLKEPDEPDEPDEMEKTSCDGDAPPVPPVLPSSTSFALAKREGRTEPEGQNCAPAPDITRQPSSRASRCPVTGGPHEYAIMRNAQGQLLCVECERPRE